MTFPTPWTVFILGESATDEHDDYGNPVTVETRTPWRVYGWAPGGSVELTGWSSQVTGDLAVYGPPPPVEVKSTDRLEVAGLEYEVDGLVKDFDHGPYGFAPGVVVPLNRATG